MGLRKEFACFSLLLLLLMLLLLKTSSFSDGSARFGTFKTGYGSELSPVESNGGSRGNGDEDGDAVLVDEKRKIHTGPNPLHNR
ncbi:hypothetical protein L1049_017810 [Liquidambar formosana]|uniref:Uncharacterized protein n=1 Tax=Liquidambar formosana TaxID=63359 RepID=A0AAP0NHD6_LIQFO